jgi:hypothetical protein
LNFWVSTMPDLKYRISVSPWESYIHYLNC